LDISESTGATTTRIPQTEAGSAGVLATDFVIALTRRAAPAAEALAIAVARADFRDLTKLEAPVRRPSPGRDWGR